MQRRNFRLAAQVLTELAPKLGLDSGRAFRAVAGCRWPGRCQQVNSRLIVDGGHNPDGLAALAESLEEAFPGETFSVVFAGFKIERGRQSAHARQARRAFYLRSAFGVGPAELHRRRALRPCPARRSLRRNDCGRKRAEALELASQDQAHKTLVAGSLYLAGEVLSLTMDKPAILNLD